MIAATTNHNIDLLTVIAIVLIIVGVVALAKRVVLLGACALVAGVILLLAYSNVFG